MKVTQAFVRPASEDANNRIQMVLYREGKIVLDTGNYSKVGR